MNRTLTLTAWRRADADKPDGIVLTDVGPGEHPGGEHWYYAGTSEVMAPQPSWWCSPAPPVDHGGLTADDIRYLAGAAPGPEAARLSQALASVEGIK